MILSWLNLNEGLAQWITAIVAVVALIYTIKDFFLKQRPWIDLEIAIAKNQDSKGGWLFLAQFVNNGTYPAIVRVEKTLMKVGDELYPAEIKETFFISPGKSTKAVLIGSIFDEGITKIRKRAYTDNVAEIYSKIVYAKIGARKLSYMTEISYKVGVDSDRPAISLIKETYT